VDTLYYAYGFFNAGDDSEMKTWQVHVSAGEGDTILLRNLIPVSSIEDEATYKALYKNNTLRVINGQYIGSIQLTIGVYDLHFMSYYNSDDRYVDFPVASDGQSFAAPESDYILLALQPTSSDHAYDQAAVVASWDVMSSASYSTDAANVPTVYYGKASNYTTGAIDYWEMYVQNGVGDTVWFTDVVPLSLGSLSTYGIRKGNTVTIPYDLQLANLSGSETTYGFFLADITEWTKSVSGSLKDIVLTEQSDGTYTLPDGAILGYVYAPVDASGNANPDSDDAYCYSTYFYNIAYATKEWSAPSVYAEADGLMLYALFTDDYNVVGNLAVASANNSVTYTNRTQAPYDSLYWETSFYTYTSSGLALDSTTSGRGETFSIYNDYRNYALTPSLSAWYKGDEGALSNAYYSYLFIYPYARSAYFTESEGSYDHFSSAQINNSYTYTDYYSEVGDDKITSIYSYQGKPNGPLYFESISLPVVNMAATSNSAAWTLLIRHCSRDAQGNIVPGDTIAMSDATIANYTQTSTYEQENGSTYTYGFITFQKFYVEDEDGFQDEYKDIFNISDEFLFELQGIDKGQLTGMIYGEGNYNPNGSKYTAYTYASAPGQIVYDTYANARLFYCYDDFISGILLTDDATSVRVPAEGGTYTWTVDPFMTAPDANGNATTGLWTKDGTDPDWIHWDVPSETYSETEAEFTLRIAVDALPAGLTGRSCNVQFEQWGAALVIEILQGDAVSGIEGVASETRAYKATVQGNNIVVACPTDVQNVTLYDATGARVVTVPVVGGKAVIPGARQGLNIVNFGGKTSVKVMK
jgi:hypothetical protein